MSSPTDLPFVIKVCGITNTEDARIAIEAGANALGFNFYPKSSRYITANVAREIIEAVPGDYLRVGIFVNPPLDEVIGTANDAQLDVVQLHGSRCPAVSSLRVWRAVEPCDLPERPDVEACLLDPPLDGIGGSGNTFDWKLAANRPFRVIIAGGLDGSNVADAIATALPWGVDACSRIESGPGKKDGNKVREFVSTAREAFRVHWQQEISI
jgi:phosphoribosylanthranilate isomerase